MIHLDLGLRMISLAPRRQLWTQTELGPFEQALAAAVGDPDTAAVAVDLHALPRLDDASVGILLEAQARLSVHDKQVVLIRPAVSVLHALAADRLLGALPAYRNISEAKHCLAKQSRNRIP